AWRGRRSAAPGACPRRRRARSRRREASGSSQRPRDELLGLGDDAPQVLVAEEALGVDLVDILRTRRTRGEPRAVRHHLHAAEPSRRRNDAPAPSSPPKPSEPSSRPATNHLKPTGTSTRRRLRSAATRSMIALLTSVLPTPVPAGHVRWPPKR